MNVIITAGGTIEKIDSSMAISNTDNSKLASHVADGLLFREKIVGNLENLFYIHTPNAVMPPRSDKIKLIEVESTNDVIETINQIMSQYKIDYFIHLMDIADYYIDFVTTPELMARDLSTNKWVCTTLNLGITRLDRSKKFSNETILVNFKPTPKIIKLIKEINNDTILVGFKRTDILEDAHKFLEDNSCDYVIVRNDKSYILSKNRKILPVDKDYKIGMNIAHLFYNDITL